MYIDFEGITDLVVVIGYIIFIVLAITTFIRLKKINMELVRARVFLKKDFIVKNLVYITIAGSLLAFHEFIHISIVKGIVPGSYDFVSESIESMSLIFLLLWLYTWQSIH